MTDLRYEKPATVADAVQLLATEPGRAGVLAGGTDLQVQLRAGRRYDLLVDIKGIGELQQLRWTEPGDLEIGACVLIQQIADDKRIAGVFTALAEAARSVGSLQIRNRGTVGGNLGNASPCADMAPPLLVLNARLLVAGPGGTRDIPLTEVFRDVKESCLEPDEIMTTIVVPQPTAGLCSAFRKLKRIRGHDLALVNAAAAFDPAARTWRLAVGSVAPTPVLVPGLDTICPPGATADEVGERLAAAALDHISPINDVRASAEYRRDMVALLCRRLARALLADS